MNDVARLLIFAGIALVVAGVVFMLFSRMGVSRLPGDFVFRRGNVTCFVPVMTSIILSIVLTLLLWLFRRG